MSMGPKQVFTANVVSNTTSTAELDMGNRQHDFLTINTGIPGAIVNVFGAAVTGGTPRALFTAVANTNTVSPAMAFAAVQFATSTSGAWLTIPAPALRFITVATTATCANGCIVTIVAS